MKFPLKRQRGFTLAEVLIASSSSMIVMGALVVSILMLQRTFSASERYAGAHAAQQRLIDYVANDLRKAVKLETWISGQWLRIPVSGELSDTFATVNANRKIRITQPGFYADNSNEILPLVSVNNKSVTYGTEAGQPAPDVVIEYTKAWVASQNSLCFLRSEGGNDPVIIARDADDMDLDVRVKTRSYEVRVWFMMPYKYRQGALQTITNADGTPITQATVITSDRVMLRNTRKD